VLIGLLIESEGVRERASSVEQGSDEVSDADQAVL
jgi:hypothetical protein